MVASTRLGHFSAVDAVAEFGQHATEPAGNLHLAHAHLSGYLTLRLAFEESQPKELSVAVAQIATDLIDRDGIFERIEVAGTISDQVAERAPPGLIGRSREDGLKQLRATCASLISETSASTAFANAPVSGIC